MKIIFFRHGETVFNIEDRFQGIANSPLTEKGIEQAHNINRIIQSGFNIGKFYLSPAMRVFQTYEIASNGLIAQEVIEPRLRECCYGDMEGKNRAELPETLLENRKKFRFTFEHPGSFQGIKGESYKQVFIRVEEFLDGILSTSSNSNQDICVISHNGVMMSVKKYFEDLADEEMNTLRISNSTYFVYDTNEESFSEYEM